MFANTLNATLEARGPIPAFGKPLPFWILAIDGGGIRGAFAAHLLGRIETEFGIDFRSRFDVVAGTSTGSIIAAAVACGIPISEVQDLYRQHGGTIFDVRWWAAGGWFFSRYRPRALKSVLDDAFGRAVLGDLARPALIIPAADIGNGQVHVFKSQYDKEFTRDKSVRIADAVLASCSAPMYFPPHEVGPYRLADGGVWANNPSLVAAVDAVTRFGRSLDNVRILSIGTGLERPTYLRKRGLLSQAWGFFTGWRRGALVDLMLSLQSQMATNMTQVLLGPGVFRLNFSDDSLSLDDPKSVTDLCARADALFTYRSEAIRRFLAPREEALSKGTSQ